MKRKPVDPDSDSLDIASLRAALMGEKIPNGKHPGPAGPVVPPPSAEDVLRSSPNLIRLCESYDQNRSRTRQRGRTQLVGLGAMVCAILVVMAILFRQGRVGSGLVYQIATAAGGASICAVLMLLILRHRDQRHLRDLQGDRLIRAVRLRCSLPTETVEAFVGQGQPTQRFFECYALWRAMSHAKSSSKTTAAADTAGH